MTDKKTYLLEKPIPEHGVLVRELVALVGVGLVVEELQRRQERDGKITNLLDLACVAFEARTTRGALHRLVEIVYRLAREISAPELRDGALALGARITCWRHHSPSSPGCGRSGEGCRRVGAS